MLEKMVVNLALSQLIQDPNFGGRYCSLTPDHSNFIDAEEHEQ
eukprot:SAG31_NODE_14946_length_779_cov_0.805882_2_plen_42_part_01